jgi:hypothetical protein
MKNPDKNLSGKSDERDVKICKNWFFTLHSLFFILWKVSFRTAKHKLWPRQRPCFIASNITFHTTKPYLSRSETLPLANLDFVNRPFTVQNSRNHLSSNTLRKTSKIAVFSTEWPFRCQHPLFFGVKIRILFDKFPLCRMRIFIAMRQALAMSDSKWCQRYRTNGSYKEDADRHQTMVASHTAVPMGTANQRSLFAKRGKVNGWYGIAPNNISLPLGRRHVLFMSLTYKARFYVWCRFPSHFEKPNGFSVWLATIVRCLSASSLQTA